MKSSKLKVVEVVKLLAKQVNKEDNQVKVAVQKVLVMEEQEDQVIQKELKRNKKKKERAKIK